MHLVDRGLSASPSAGARERARADGRPAVDAERSGGGRHSVRVDRADARMASASSSAATPSSPPQAGSPPSRTQRTRSCTACSVPSRSAPSTRRRAAARDSPGCAGRRRPPSARSRARPPRRARGPVTRSISNAVKRAVSSPASRTPAPGPASARRRASGRAALAEPVPAAHRHRLARQHPQQVEPVRPVVREALHVDAADVLELAERRSRSARNAGAKRRL